MEPALQPLIDFLAATIAPARIYRMKELTSPLIKADPVIDLLIIMKGSSASGITELETLIKITRENFPNLQCSFHQQGTVEDCLRRGHILYSLHCIQENCIYDNSGKEYPVTVPEKVHELKQAATEQFQFCYTRAKEFLQAAINLYQERKSALTMFLLHQSVEFIYRGVIKSLHGIDKRTHELRVLVKMVRHHARQLNEVIHNAASKQVQLITELDRAYIDARYEQGYAVKDETIKALCAIIPQLHHRAMEVVKQSLEVY